MNLEDISLLANRRRDEHCVNLIVFERTTHCRMLNSFFNLCFLLSLHSPHLIFHHHLSFPIPSINELHQFKWKPPDSDVPAQPQENSYLPPNSNPPIPTSPGPHLGH